MTVLTLLLPGLIPAAGRAEPAEQALLAPLDRRMRRAAFRRDPPASVDVWLAARFGMAAPLAHGALAAFGCDCHGDAESVWLRADPVTLAVWRDGLVLRPFAPDQLTQAEASALLATLAPHARADGIRLHVATPHHWLAEFARGTEVATVPLVEVAGEPIFGRLPSRAGGARLRQFATELQMLLYEHPVNAARAARGAAAVNSLWFWGEGRLPHAPARPFARVVSCDPTLAGLARLAGLDLQVALSLETPMPPTLLAELDLPAARHAGADAALPLMQRLMSDTLVPLFALLDAGRLARLEIVVPDARGVLNWTLRAQDRFRFWRQSPSRLDVA